MQKEANLHPDSCHTDFTCDSVVETIARMVETADAFLKHPRPYHRPEYHEPGKDFRNA